MTGHLEDVSGARILAGTTSFFGIILLGIAMIAGNPSPIAALFALPFLVVLVVSIAPLPASTRALFLWICAAAAVFPAALTIFSGIGFFLAAIILAWLVAAWNENRAAS